ncbi:MAG: molecular chaperone HtpG [Deltaproteobacteria bacterium]|nr:molecular chaperone HtpG [Deltaproteobacteria bacterium]
MAETQEPAGFTVHEKRHWASDEETPSPSSELNQEGAQTLSFQTETQQLLELMIHSLYSNKEIFLRELISNASDALDRYRFTALTETEFEERDDLGIRLEVDKDARTLTIHDNGIGMSRGELVRNIGTIARSGSREILSQLKLAQKEDAQPLELIGQFGVGFYSAFMAADRVKLITRRAGEPAATSWQSTGDGSYTIDDAQREEHGTSITLHLKDVNEDDGIGDFTEEWTLDRVIKRYSDFVRYPITIEVEREEPVLDEEGKPKEGETKTVQEERTLNSMKAIWMRPASEVEDNEYDEFYKHIAHDWEKPRRRIALAAEGRLEYRALLFIPSHAPHDFFYQESKAGLSLYLRNVKIMEECEELLPRYLRFVKGVVDSPDLPLNVSRELLQHNRQLTQIQKGVVKKVLSTLKEMLDKEREEYLEVWTAFGRALKEGVVSNADNKDRLMELMLFSSSDDAKKLSTLAEYIERMKEGQEEIYYLTGDSRQSIEGSPHLEAFTAKGYEVLFLSDPIDELLVQYVTEHEGKALKSVGKGEVELGSEEERKEAEEARKTQQEGLSGLLTLLQEKLDEHVKEVRLSSRLTTSAVCLVTDEHDESPQLQRLLKQTRAKLPTTKRIMELNGEHPLVASLSKRYEANKSDDVLESYAQLLFGQALLAEGSELPDPAAFSKLVADVMARGI